MEAAHKDRMEQFKAKVKQEQEAQIQTLKAQMDNERKEVGQLLSRIQCLCLKLKIFWRNSLKRKYQQKFQLAPKAI